MRLHTSIYYKFLSVFRMSKPALNIRFSPAVMDKMDELVQSGKYTTKAEIVNQAVIEFLHGETLRPVIREEIEKWLREKD